MLVLLLAGVQYAFYHWYKTFCMAQKFFIGGILRSIGIIRLFGGFFVVVFLWGCRGFNYARTANDWLANMDRNERAVAQVLQLVYGDDAKLWQRRWRLFFLATAGLFGHRAGEEWGVSHYLLRPVPA
jgi:cyclopropane-fatty-acyl-phospholipid synthase